MRSRPQPQGGRSRFSVSFPVRFGRNMWAWSCRWGPGGDASATPSKDDAEGWALEGYLRPTLAGGHAASNAPDLFRPPKLSGADSPGRPQGAASFGQAHSCGGIDRVGTPQGTPPSNSAGRATAPTTAGRARWAWLLWPEGTHERRNHIQLLCAPHGVKYAFLASVGRRSSSSLS